MDKLHTILLVLIGVLLVAFGLSQNTKSDFKKEIQSLKNERLEHLKIIKKNDQKILQLEKSVSKTDTIIKIVTHEQIKDDENWGDSVRFISNANDSIIWQFLAKRYIKDSSKGLRN